MINGLPPAEAKGLRYVFVPVYESSFQLQCPRLDESMGHTLKCLKSSSSSVADLVEKTWLSTCYKIFDIAHPLIQLWGLLPPDDILNQYVESALRHWGVVFSEIEHPTPDHPRFHQSAIGPVSFLHSCNWPPLWSPLPQSSVKRSGRRESKIAKIGRNGGSHRRLTRYSFRGSRGAQQQTSYGSQQLYTSSAFFQPARGSGNSQRSGTNAIQQNCRMSFEMESACDDAVSEHFKMEGVESLKQLICQDDWMVKLDLKDAYLAVPVRKEHQLFWCIPYMAGPLLSI
ncbi:hypothetical protein OUZ56_021800 [Daphnia magna]|uniref:Reverse transcriptase domain-containing protein n=1 Tax=Daphnia magna TaxID=35525 RepID=A0ABR0AUH1_9CRUS|nr:hypothetical protein OUZ56_021800 [Daphnia magna]